MRRQAIRRRGGGAVVLWRQRCGVAAAVLWCCGVFDDFNGALLSHFCRIVGETLSHCCGVVVELLSHFCRIVGETLSHFCRISV